MTEAVLSIFYTAFNGKVCNKSQGKIFQHDGTWVYLADMTPNKWMHNYNGYGIADQIIEAFRTMKIRPRIIYRRRDLHTMYETTLKHIKDHAPLAKFGGHAQWFLPLGKGKFEAITWTDFHEPKDLPILSVKDWMREPAKDYSVPAPVSFTVKDHVDAWMRLRQIAITKGIL